MVKVQPPQSRAPNTYKTSADSGSETLRCDPVLNFVLVILSSRPVTPSLLISTQLQVVCVSVSFLSGSEKLVQKYTTALSSSISPG